MSADPIDETVKALANMGDEDGASSAGAPDPSEDEYAMQPDDAAIPSDTETSPEKEDLEKPAADDADSRADGKRDEETIVTVTPAVKPEAAADPYAAEYEALAKEHALPVGAVKAFNSPAAFREFLARRDVPPQVEPKQPPITATEAFPPFQLKIDGKNWDSEMVAELEGIGRQVGEYVEGLRAHYERKHAELSESVAPLRKTQEHMQVQQQQEAYHRRLAGFEARIAALGDVWEPKFGKGVGAGLAPESAELAERRRYWDAESEIAESYARAGKTLPSDDVISRQALYRAFPEDVEALLRQEQRDAQTRRNGTLDLGPTHRKGTPLSPDDASLSLIAETSRKAGVPEPEDDAIAEVLAGFPV